MSLMENFDPSDLNQAMKTAEALVALLKRADRVLWMHQYDMLRLGRDDASWLAQEMRDALAALDPGCDTRSAMKKLRGMIFPVTAEPPVRRGTFEEVEVKK